MTRDPKSAHERLTKSIMNLMVIGEIMKTLASGELSNSDAIEGTVVLWLAEQVQENTEVGNQALGKLRREGRA